MSILIHLSSHLMAELIQQLFTAHGYDDVVVSGRPSANGSLPEVLLVDTTTHSQRLLARYPEAKVLLLDNVDVDPETLCAAIRSYIAYGILLPHAGLQEVRVENGSVKASFHDAEGTSAMGAISGTDAKPEIIRSGQRRQG